MRQIHLKRLMSDLTAQPFLLILASLGTILQVLLTIYLPILIGRAVDSVLLPQAENQLLPILWRMLFVILMNTIIQWFNPLVYNHLVYSYCQELREKVMVKIHLLPLSFLDKLGNGDLVSRVTTDLEQLGNGLLMIFNFLLAF